MKRKQLEFHNMSCDGFILFRHCLCSSDNKGEDHILSLFGWKDGHKTIRAPSGADDFGKVTSRARMVCDGHFVGELNRDTIPTITQHCKITKP